MSRVKVIAVASGKGGVGKTNVSVNLAYQLSRAGRKVLLLDADLGLANVDILLNLKPKRNLSDVLEGHCSLKDILVTAPGGFTVIPAASGKKGMAEMAKSQHAGIVMAMSELDQDFDVMIVDTAAGISDSVVTFSQASHHVTVVCSDEPTSMADAYALIKVLSRDAGIERFKVLRNRLPNDLEARAGFKRLEETANRFLNVQLEYAGYIPDDPFVAKAVSRQRCVSEAFPSSPSAKAFKTFADKTDSWDTPVTPHGGLEFFVDRMSS
ncbi:flagellar biosynthesis protein FlhG [Litorivivens lipolytica]|uniref:Flagellar biosynthesis protein FlhG n=1 Tax=Litorivivens lipolytica TaxID=1524264 RepID=A0A7W4Z5X2_9GAMM|nr:flagellar biosynthesis protein FlhG [Litorivivens lipolytica]